MVCFWLLERVATGEARICGFAGLVPEPSQETAPTECSWDKNDMPISCKFQP